MAVLFVFNQIFVQSVQKIGKFFKIFVKQNAKLKGVKNAFNLINVNNVKKGIN